jgi:hypothetical protein
VTRYSYLDLLELYALPQLPPQNVLQQDGTPPHFCQHIRYHLNREIAGRCISRHGPISWLLSPDLTPLDFFLLELCEEHIYQATINDLQHLKTRIRDAVATVTQNILQTTWNEVEYRLHICRATKGAHIKIY